jgi:5-methylcytosine-specific restriction endonuclease McrA
MSRVKIKFLGKLCFSEEGGLKYSVSLNQPPNVSTSILFYELPLLTDLSELTVGDFVVHADHGVARYQGVQHLSLKGGAPEAGHLLLEYAGNERLYVPKERIDLVWKYRGNPPKLDRLKHDKGSTPRTEERQPKTYWLEALPRAYEWPGLGAFPEITREDYANEAKKAEWHSTCHAYKHALHADPKYRQAASELLERQRREPQPLLAPWWAYRDKVLVVESTEPEGLHDRATEILLVKHYVLRHERNYEKVRREVETLENLTQLEGVGREPIAESVRLFVWQRDKGRCVKCGSRERLEFDHIIPIIAGGSSTERNIQLLCESCNRSKGATV